MFKALAILVAFAGLLVTALPHVHNHQVYSFIHL